MTSAIRMFLTVTEAGDVSEQAELAVKWAIERGLIYLSTRTVAGMRYWEA